MIKNITQEAFKREHRGGEVNWRSVVIDVDQALRARKPAVFRRENYEDAGRVVDEMVREGYCLHHWQAMDDENLDGVLNIVMMFFPHAHPEGTVDVLWLQTYVREWRDAQPNGEARAAFDKVLELLP